MALGNTIRVPALGRQRRWERETVEGFDAACRVCEDWQLMECTTNREAQA